MRFDDTIATVLAFPSDTSSQRTATWRQLVDLLAQRRCEPTAEMADRAFAYLHAHRHAVAPEVRRRAAESLAGLPVTPRLLAYFAEDQAGIVAPLIARARLTTSEWLEILPLLGPAPRALLRHREDLDLEVKRALGLFGASDFVIESHRTNAAAAEPIPPVMEHNESQIRELVERIEAFRRQREGSAQASSQIQPGEPIEGFRWESGNDGIVRWVDGAPRGSLVGQSIATIAEPGQQGVDGQAAGAFEKRAPFRDARFSVAGEGEAGGDWRISGVPYFDPQRGNFCGYRGTARRPRLDEIAQATTSDVSGLFGPRLPADALRQLVHELRTPLNAIIGFAELIEGQFMGPASSNYRGRAGDIVANAKKLLSAVDDLDTAARIETRRLEVEEGAIDICALLGRLFDSYERVARQRGSNMTLSVEPNLPHAKVDASAAERMVSRTLAATIGLAEEGETIGVHMAAARRGDREMLGLTVDRPNAIEGVAERALLDPGYSPDGDWPGAPALGLGFALRLVRNLAEAAGGVLLIDDRQISLFLPAYLDKPEKAGQEAGTP